MMWLQSPDASHVTSTVYCAETGFGRSHTPISGDSSLTIFNNSKIKTSVTASGRWVPCTRFPLYVRSDIWCGWNGKPFIFEVMQFRSIRFPHVFSPSISTDATTRLTDQEDRESCIRLVRWSTCTCAIFVLKLHFPLLVNLYSSLIYLRRSRELNIRTKCSFNACVCQMPLKIAKDERNEFPPNSLTSQLHTHALTYF